VRVFRVEESGGGGKGDSIRGEAKRGKRDASIMSGDGEVEAEGERVVGLKG